MRGPFRHIFYLLMSCAVAYNAYAADTLSVERIFSKPYLAGVSVSNIQWSPDGSSIAYLRADANSDLKDLWLFTLATGKGALLLRADDMLTDGQTFSEEELMVRERTRQTDLGITAYFWSVDGKSIFIPLNGDIHRFDLATRTPTRLTKTEEYEFDPKQSPDGRWLSYVREGEIFALNLESGGEIKLTTGATAKVKNGIAEFVAQEEMDRTTGYWWSPDAGTIAYVQTDNTPVKEFHIPNFLTDYTGITAQEYAKAGEANTIVKVGVVSIADGTTRWLDLGSNNDIYVARVDWVPDSKQLAVQIQSRNQDTLDLYLYNIADGSRRLLLRETDPRWVTLHDDLRFLPSRNQFLWSSERDGYRQLFVYSMDGTAVRRLLRGEWEMDKVEAVDEQAGVVYFTGREKSPTERHLYSIRLDATGFSRLSEETGWHEGLFSPDRKHYVHTYSSAARPPMVVLSDNSGKTIASIEENRVPDFNALQLPQAEFIQITRDDGTVLHAYLIKPPFFDSRKRYPVIQYVYNGPGSQVVLNQWGASGGTARSLWHRAMAERGYIIFGVDGRGTPGRGRPYLNPIHRRLGFAELEDQLVGLSHLRSLPFVDTSRVMIWGKSYGGFMTCMAMFTAPGAYKLGIAVAPVTDWHNYDTHYTERFLERPSENPEGYRLSSPINFVEGLKGKFLLVHGVVDDNVHFQDAMVLAKKLQDANKQFDFMAYPASTHSFSGAAVGTHLYNFLARYIQNNL